MIWNRIGGSVVLLGDYDNDGDLDLLLNNSGSGGMKLLRFERNSGYVDSGIQFPIPANEAHWIDYNNDNFLDILFVVRTFLNDPATLTLYKNEGGNSFSEVEGKVPSDIEFQWQGGLSLGDYDNDGDEDLLLQAERGSVMHLYDNDGEGGFTRNRDINLSGHMKCYAAWADYDKDGDLDILANREISCEKNIIVIFENKSDKSFTSVEFANLEGVSGWNNPSSDMKWGDYDNDGFPDIIVAGHNTCTLASGITRIYHNNGNKTFSLAADLVGLKYDASVDWGDYDNDGDLDVFAYGDTYFGGTRTRIYKNVAGKFKETNVNYLLESEWGGNAAPSDIDNDGDLDLVILGRTSFAHPSMIVYRNTYAESWGLANHKPNVPGLLQSNVNADQSVSLSWSKSTDQETAKDGLTYNVYLVNESNSIVLNSYSLASGYRKVVTVGNTAIPMLHLKIFSQACTVGPFNL